MKSLLWILLVILDERKVAKLIEKTPEAKSRNHVIGCYRRLSEIVSEKAVNALLKPLKDHLLVSVDKRLHLQVDKALNAISDGLISNESMKPKYCIILAAQIFKDGLEATIERKKAQTKEKKRPGEKPQSCLLLDKPKTRTTIGEPEREKVTNRHYLIQFGLQLIQSSIKVEKIKIDGQSDEDTEVLSHLDGLVQIMVDMLVESRHMAEQAKILRIFSRLLKNPNFPSLKDKMINTKLQKEIFSILKASCRGTRQNQDFVSAVFKAITVLINSPYSCLGDIHLQVLLNYAEEDLYNAERQTFAFPLLHALLKRQLRTPEMDAIGDKILKLAVTADSEAGRNSAKNFFCAYLMGYRLGEDKIHKFLDKLLGNLAYGIESGRSSVLECLFQVITQFPERLLSPKSTLFFSALCAAFSGDESFNLRERAGELIQLLVKKYPNEDYYKLMSKFIKNEDFEQKRLTLLLVDLLHEDNSDSFLIKDLFEEMIYLFREDFSEDSSDSILVALLQAFDGLNSKLELYKKWPEEYAEILSKIEEFLVHPHAWVRQSASRIFYSILEKVSADNESSPEDVIMLKGFWTEKKARDLALKHIVQLKRPHVEREHMEENKNVIILLLRMFHQTEDPESDKKSDLLYLVQKLNSVAAFENSDLPNEVVRREIVVEIFITYLSVYKGEAKHLNVILEVFYREVAAGDDSKQTPEELKRAVYQASMVVKKMIGDDIFTSEWEAARKQITSRRSERKRKLDQQAIIDPEAFNRKNIKKHEKERKRKKKLLEERKMVAPGTQSKKQKFNSVEKM